MKSFYLLRKNRFRLHVVAEWSRWYWSRDRKIQTLIVWILALLLLILSRPLNAESNNSEARPPVDLTPPVVTFYYPSSGSTDVSIQPGLRLDFDELVQMKAGKSFKIWVYDTDVLASTVSSFEGSQVYIEQFISEQIEDVLDYSTLYYITVEEGTFEDLSGNLQAAITDKDIWKFTTREADSTPPSISDFEVPSNGATEFPLYPWNFYVSFDESIYFNEVITGVVELHLSSDGSVVKTYSSVDFSGANASSGFTISNDIHLLPSTSYYLTIGSGIIEDPFGNEYAGFTEATTWAFTTRSRAQEDAYITALSPSTGSTGVSLNPTVTISFGETVSFGDGTDGSISLVNSTTDELIKEWDFSAPGDYELTDGVSLALTGIPTLSNSTTYHFEMQNGTDENPALFVFQDLEERYAGWENDFWTFTTVEPALQLTALSPASGATGVDPNTTLVLTFNKNVTTTGSGAFGIYRKLDDVQFGVSWYLPNVATFIDNQVTITIPTVNSPLNLEENTEYYVKVENGIQSGSETFDISDDATWTFTTGDFTNPILNSVSPADNTTDLAVEVDFVLTFSENIVLGTALITLFDDGGQQLESYSSTNNTDRITILDNVLTIDRESDLQYNKGYSFHIQANAIKDASGNSFAGFTDDDTWNFKTIATGVAPTDIELSTTTFNEDVQGGDVLITLSGTDPDNNISYYELIDVEGSGTAYDDFYVSENLLYSGGNGFDYLTKNQYSIRIKVVDEHNNEYTEDFTLSINKPDSEAPSLVSVTPADGTTGVNRNATLEFTFSEDLIIPVNGADKAIILKSTDNTFSQSYAFADSNVEVSGNTITITDPELPYSKEIYSLIFEGVVADAYNNWVLDINTLNSWSITTEDDTYGPQIVSYSPAHLETGVSVDITEIVITYDEPIQINANASTNSVLKFFRNGYAGVPDLEANLFSNALTVNGNDLLIELPRSLFYNEHYQIGLAGELITDVLGNTSDGINYDGSYQFTTESTTDSEAPTLIRTYPESGAVEVELSGTISLKFSEPVFNNFGFARIFRKNGGVLYDNISFYKESENLKIYGDSIVLDPGSNFAGGTEYYLVFDDNILLDQNKNVFTDLSSTTAYTFTTLTPDQTAPTIVSFSPVADATDVDVNGNLTITFSEEVVAGSGNIQIQHYNSQAFIELIDVTSENVTIEGSVVTIHPVSPLPYDSKMYVYINGGTFQDLAGNEHVLDDAIAEKGWFFTTEAEPDTEAPYMVSISPENNAQGVSINPTFILTYNEPIVPNTSGVPFVRLMIFPDQIEQVQLENTNLVQITDNQISIQFSNPLSYSTSYLLATFSGMVMDLSGNANSENPNISFTTEDQDLAGPQFVSGSPANGAVGVGINETLTLTFDEELTIPGNGATKMVILRSSDQTFAKSYSLENEEATITGSQITIPNPSLPYGKTIHGEISEGVVADLAGNWISDLNTASIWSITTENDPDLDVTAPTISATVPDYNFVIDVPVNTPFSLTFNEKVVPGSGAIKLSNAEGILEMIDPANMVTEDEFTYSYTLQNQLPYSSTILVVIEQGAFEDLAGNEYSNPTNGLNYSFVTVAEPDTEAPYMVSISPENNAQGVSINPTFILTYNEPIVPNTSGFPFVRLMIFPDQIEQVQLENTNLVQITDNQISIQFSNPLSFSTSYLLATFSGMVMDLSGNANSENPNISFTTEDQDLAGPQFVSGSPANGAVGVGINETLTLTFDEELTIPGNGATKMVILRSSDQTFAKSYSLENEEATITGSQITIPNPSLPYGKTIHGEISEGVLADLAGNWISDLNTASIWSITTENDPDLDVTAPTISATVPDYNFVIDVPVNTPFSLTFNEKVVPGSGAIKLSNAEGVLEIIDPANMVTEDEFTYSYTLQNQLPYSSTIMVVIEQGAFEDLAGNEYSNPTNGLNYSFVTVAAPDTEAPYIVSLSPNDDATDVAVDEALIATFSESIMLGENGATKIAFIKRADGTNFASVDLTSEHISENTLTIPHATFETGQTYYISIAEGVLTDLSNNFFQGFTTNTDWNFTIQTESTKLEQTITFDQISVYTYGDAEFNLEASASSGLEISYVSSNTDVATISGSLVTIKGAGETVITANQAGNSQYFAATSVSKTLIVEKASQEITIASIENQNTTGGPIAIEASVDSGLPLTYEVSGPATLSGLDIALTGLTGTVVVTVNQAGDGNYLPASANTSFNVIDVSKPDQTITFQGIASKTYGDDPFEVEVSSSSGLPINLTVSSGPASVAGSMVTITGAGMVTLRALQNGDNIFNPAPEALISFNVVKRPLTIAANNLTKIYGEADPVYTYQVTSGSLIGSDQLSGNPSRIAGNGVGTYAIKKGSLSAGTNYEITFIESSLEILKKELQVIAADKIITFGEQKPLLTFSYSGFVNNESSRNIVPPTISCGATDLPDAGDYAIELSGGSSSNYRFTLINGVLTVAKAVLTVTSEDKSRVYGELNPVFTFTYEGFKFNETNAVLTTLPSAATSATMTSDVGTYSIIPTGAEDENYQFNYVEGHLVIAQANLTITVNDVTMTEGEAVPDFTFSFDGFLNGDTESDLDELPVATSNGTSSSPIGEYVISLSGGAAINYQFTLVNGVLTIVEAEQPLANELMPVELSVYPNPVSSLLHVITPQEMTISIYDLNGRRHLAGVSGTPLDVSHLPSGVYLVQINDQILRFIKE